jgi:hypothetical protein
MNRRRISTIAGAAALIGGATAHARISVDPATGRVSCETGAGHFSQRTIAGRTAEAPLAARIRLVTPASSARWVPAAGFLFTAPGDRNAGVQIALSPDDSSIMLVGLRLPGRSQLIRFGSFPADRWITLSASLSADGLLAVTVAGRTERRRVRLQGPIEPKLHCNSGIFEFELAPGTRLADPPAGEE